MNPLVWFFGSVVAFWGFIILLNVAFWVVFITFLVKSAARWKRLNDAKSKIIYDEVRRRGL
jgi:hypothetical protein